jgi:hypothetical protein
MLPAFLLEDGIRRENGISPPLQLAQPGQPLLLTLGITRIIEQESLDVAIHGSSDGETWTEKPLLEFPQKFYCGGYARILDLAPTPDVRFLRAHWKMSRWGRGEPTPLFGFYLFAEPAAVRPLAAAAAAASPLAG